MTCQEHAHFLALGLKALQCPAGAVPPSYPSGAAPPRPGSSLRSSSDGVRAWSVGSAGWPEAAAPAAANRAPQLPAGTAAQKAQQQQQAVAQQLSAGGRRGLQAAAAGQPLQLAAGSSDAGQLLRHEAAGHRQAVRGQSAGPEAASSQLSGLPEPRAAPDQQRQQPGHVAGAAGRPSVHLADGQVPNSRAAGGQSPPLVGPGQRVQHPAGRIAPTRRDAERAAASDPLQVQAGASSPPMLPAQEHIQAQSEDQVCVSLFSCAAVSALQRVCLLKAVSIVVVSVHLAHNQPVRNIDTNSGECPWLLLQPSVQTFHWSTVMFPCLETCRQPCSGCTSRQT